MNIFFIFFSESFKFQVDIRYVYSLVFFQCTGDNNFNLKIFFKAFFAKANKGNVSNDTVKTVQNIVNTDVNQVAQDVNNSTDNGQKIITTIQTIKERTENTLLQKYPKLRYGGKRAFGKNLVYYRRFNPEDAELRQLARAYGSTGLTENEALKAIELKKNSDNRE